MCILIKILCLFKCCLILIFILQKKNGLIGRRLIFPKPNRCSTCIMKRPGPLIYWDLWTESGCKTSEPTNLGVATYSFDSAWMTQMHFHSCQPVSQVEFYPAISRPSVNTICILSLQNFLPTWRSWISPHHHFPGTCCMSVIILITYITVFGVI